MLNDDALALMAAINKKCGAETVVLGSDMVIRNRYTTGSLALDVALGGGLPANHWTEIIGSESAGKTALCLKIIADNQARDRSYTTFWLASERYDEQQAAALGVDNSRVMVSPTQDMERAFDLLLAATESQAATCIVLDSYPALLPREEDEKGMEGFSTAVGARLVNQWIRKSGKASQRSVLGTDRPFHGLFVNQYRDKIGGFHPAFGGPPQTTPGGNGKNYFFYARIEVKRDEYITEKRPGIEQPVKVGQRIRFTTIKNKSAAPQQRAYVDFYFRGAPFLGFRRGDFDLGREYVEMGRLFGVIQLSGAWHLYGGEKWQGKDAMRAAIREDVGLKEKLRADVLEAASDPLLVDQIQPEELKAVTGHHTRKVTRERKSEAGA